MTRNEAIAVGLTRYFTGKPCKHGHVSERLVLGRGCATCKVAWQRTEKYREYHRVYKRTPVYLEKDHAYERERRRGDPVFKLICAARSRIYGALKRRRKSASTLKLLGVPSIEFYQSYIAAQFKPGMTWKNFGTWHIDHIKPLSSFDLSNPKMQTVAFNYRNTRPLWAIENMVRGNRSET